MCSDILRLRQIIIIKWGLYRVIFLCQSFQETLHNRNIKHSLLHYPENVKQWSTRKCESTRSIHQKPRECQVNPPETARVPGQSTNSVRVPGQSTRNRESARSIHQKPRECQVNPPTVWEYQVIHQKPWECQVNPPTVWEYQVNSPETVRVPGNSTRNRNSVREIHQKACTWVSGQFTRNSKPDRSNSYNFEFL